jgi:hypothetical protein
LAGNAALIVGLSLATSLLTLRSRQPGMAAVTSGLAVFLGFLLYGSIWAQQGLPEAAGAPMPDAALALGSAVGLAVGIGHALLVRTRPGVAPYPRPFAPEGAVRARVPDTALASWSGPLRHGVLGSLLLTASVALLLGFAVWLWRIDGPWLPMLLLALVVSALLVPLQLAVVVVDSRGVSLKVAGRTLSATALSQIAEARRVEVRALREFGGIGYRAGSTGGGVRDRLGRSAPADPVRASGPGVHRRRRGAGRGVVNTLVDRQAESEGVTAGLPVRLAGLDRCAGARSLSDAEAPPWRREDVGDQHEVPFLDGSRAVETCRLPAVSSTGRTVAGAPAKV